MNFASHYFFQGGSSDLFNAGLLLADLIPQSQKIPFPLMPAVKKLLHDGKLTQTDKDLFNGIYSHFQADILFHRSDFFHTAVYESIDIAGGNNRIPSPLHHILIELYMDRFLAINNPAMVSEMYDSFTRCFKESLAVFSKHIHLETETVYLCERFLLKRNVERYRDFAVIAEILTSIGNHVRIPFTSSSETINLVEQVYNALASVIKEYFEKSQHIYSQITVYSS